MVAREFTRRSVALTSIPRIQVSTGAAQNARNLATVFGGISNKLEQQLDIDRQVVGKKQGAAEAATGAPVLKEDNTIFARAFNDAAISTYSTRISIQARTRLVELEAENNFKPAEYLKQTNAYIAGIVQEAKNISPELSTVFKAQMELLQGQAKARIFGNFIKAQKEEHEGTVRSLADVLGHDLGLAAPGLLSDDPDVQAEALATIEAGIAQFGIALNERGADGNFKIKPKDAEAKTIQLRNSVLESAIQGWFGSFDDRTDAANQLISEKFKDKNVQTLFDLLDNKTQQRIKSELIRDESRLATIANRQRDDSKDREERQDVGVAVDILLNDDTTLAEKNTQAKSLRSSPHITIATKEKIDLFIRNGGRDDGLDVEASVLEVERQIRNGELKTDIDVMNAVSQAGGISLATMRTRFIPLLETVQDKEFKDALDEGQARLGYDRSAASAGLFPDRARKGLLLQARMLKFDRDNKEKVRAGEPVEDVFEFMERQVSLLQKSLNQKAASGIPNMVHQYKTAKLSGSAKNIARAKANLTSVLVDAGVVDSITASATGFDPIAAIDERAKKIRGAQ